MATAMLLGTIPGHLHWCPRCDTEWACPQGLLDCPEGGAVAVLTHCDRALPEDEE
jgi:hypothetical protein